MDFKSTILIFGAALIFILPLVISSPLSGEESGAGGKSMRNENKPKTDSLNITYIKYHYILTLTTFSEI